MRRELSSFSESGSAPVSELPFRSRTRRRGNLSPDQKRNALFSAFPLFFSPAFSRFFQGSAYLANDIPVGVAGDAVPAAQARICLQIPPIPPVPSVGKAIEDLQARQLVIVARSGDEARGVAGLQEEHAA
eukprot:scaffold134_cov244-Pinguiococcus_pyrenoidosus.AAC.4